MGEAVGAGGWDGRRWWQGLSLVPGGDRQGWAACACQRPDSAAPMSPPQRRAARPLPDTPARLLPLKLLGRPSAGSLVWGAGAVSCSCGSQHAPRCSALGWGMEGGRGGPGEARAWPCVVPGRNLLALIPAGANVRVPGRSSWARLGRRGHCHGEREASRTLPGSLQWESQARGSGAAAWSPRRPRRTRSRGRAGLRGGVCSAVSLTARHPHTHADGPSGSVCVGLGLGTGLCEERWGHPRTHQPVASSPGSTVHKLVVGQVAHL